MATHIWNGGALHLNGLDGALRTRSFSIEVDVEAVDMTTLSQTTRVNAAGLRSVTWAAEGLSDEEANPWLFTPISSSTQSGAAFTVLYMPSGGAAEDEVCYFFRARAAKMTLPMTVGEAATIIVSGETADLASGFGAQTLVSGRLSARGSAVSASANGTGRQLGELASARALMFMGGVVTGLTGTANVTFILESDDNGSFTSATTRATSSAFSSADDVWVAPVPGPITDDYWRVRYTITGTGTASFRVAMGRVVLP